MLRVKEKRTRAAYSGIQVRTRSQTRVLTRDKGCRVTGGLSEVQCRCVGRGEGSQGKADACGLQN